MVGLSNVMHETGSLGDYSVRPLTPADLRSRYMYPPAFHIVTVKCVHIVSFTCSRVDAMCDLCNLLSVDIKTAKRILNNLPHLICETTNVEEYRRWYKAARQLRFTIKCSEYSRTEIV